MEDIPKTALPMKLFPSPLKHIVGKMLTTLRNRVHYTKCAHHLEPLFAARLSDCQADSEILPNNYATWSVRDAIKRNDESEKTPDMLSRRLMAVNFGAIHTTTMTIANLILDMATSPGCLDDIQAECKGLSQKYGSEWNRVRLADMVVVDSSLRESMRLSGFGSITLTRNVMAPRGLAFPDGTHIPRGATVCVSGHSLHHDESIYPDPYAFQYTRFMQSSETKGAARMKTAVTTEPIFSVWGHGKHACPGRFFAVDMIKMIMAYIAANYEIRPLSERPENMWIVHTPIPPPSTVMEVRRRSPKPVLA